MTDAVVREHGPKWLLPIARQLTALGYSFKHHFGRTYDGSFGELVTDVHDLNRVRVVWMDLNSSPDMVWLKMYFASEEEQQRAVAALQAVAGHLLQGTAIEARKSSGYATCPWMVNLSMQRDADHSDHGACTLPGWFCASLVLAETAGADASGSASGI